MKETRKKVFIAYADEKYRKTRDFAGKMAKIIGEFDKVVLYGPKDVDDDFKEQHKNTFAIKRGAGLWLWKPYIIAKALREECEDGDFLFYADSGSFFIRSVNHIIKAMANDDIYVSQIPLVEWQFTKTDCFKLMNCDDEKVKKSAQIQGSFVCVKKNQHSIDFINTWLNLCSDLRLLHPNNIALGLKNPDDFFAHREDQSILSLLCKTKGIKPHMDPTQYSKLPEHYWWFKNFIRVHLSYKKEYPICILLHRSPTVRFLSVVKEILIILLPRFVSVLYLHRNK